MTDISIVIPAYNSADFIESTLRELRDFLLTASYTFEIIVVDDSSADQTAAIVQRLTFPELRLLRHECNQGKFGALTTGMHEARGRCCIFTDADLPYELTAIPYIADLILRREFHLVIGDRTLQSSSYHAHMNWLRYVTTIVFSFFVRMLITGGLFDTQCGLKGFRSDIAKTIFPMLRDRRFAGDVELLWIALSYNLEIKRIPVRLQRSGTTTVRVFSDGFHMLMRIATLRWNWIRHRYYSIELEKIARQSYERDESSKN